MKLKLIIVALTFFLILPDKIYSQNNLLRIAAIFSKSTSLEYVCVIKGVIEEARSNGALIDLDFFDFKNELSELVNVSEKVSLSGYDVVIGPRTSQEALVSVPIFHKVKIPQILPVASLGEVSKKFNNVFRIIGSTDLYAKKMAFFIAKFLKPKKILVIANLSTPYSAYYKSALSNNIKAFGSNSTISFIDIIDGSIDYNKITEKVVQEVPDVIYAPVYDVDLTNIYAHLLDKKISVKIVTHAGMFVGMSVLRQHIHSSIDLFYNGIWDHEIKEIKKGKFESVLTKYCGKNIQNVRTAASYDAALLALEVGKVLKRSKIKESKEEKLYKAKKVKINGVFGVWKGNEFGEVERSLPVYKLTKSGEVIYKIIK